MYPLITSVFLFFHSPAIADSINHIENEGPKPVVVIIEKSSWQPQRTPTEVNDPTIALYENGLLVFRTANDTNGHQYVQRLVSKSEFNEVCRLFNLVLDLSHLKLNYSVAKVFDAGSVESYIRLDSREVTISVYPAYISIGSEDGFRMSAGSLQPDQPPGQLCDAVSYLVSLARGTSERWTPTSFEVIIWGGCNPAIPLVTWPKNWPVPISNSLLQLASIYSIYLPMSKYDEVTSFIDSHQGRYGFEIEGQRWQVCYRTMFPNEKMWGKQNQGEN